MSLVTRTEPVLWQVEDVRGICTVAAVGGRPVRNRCGFCGQGFDSSGWVRVSVARSGFGGSVADLCPSCSTSLWESIVTHLAAITEQLRLADAFRRQLGL
jgi:hypothetical protein